MRILFQGDSITDAARDREDDDVPGVGYVRFVKAQLGFKEPGKHEFINRGISGNCIVDVYARMRSDIINLKPDVMSILIGVNDVWHEFEKSPNGVPADKFYRIYDMLIEEVKEALPNLKIMIFEPFVLKGSGTEPHWDEFKCEVEKRAAMAKKIAEKYNLPFIELQAGFNKLSELAEPAYWLYDGVHPTPMGHQFLTNQWIEAFHKLGL